ncbi:pilin [Patescibacteria group bacterium]|nr:pilin [Patescibacteria group bacterium]
MTKLFKTITASIATYALVFSANVTLAAEKISGWGTKESPSFVPTDIRGAIMNLTNWILGFISIIATLVIIYGGVLYLTAAGNDDNVATAKKTISYGIIGVVIAGLAYAMVIVVSTVILSS